MNRRKSPLLIGESKCPACGQDCLVKVSDFGWDFVYGSEKGTHHDYRPVSDCCEEELSDDSINWQEVDYDCHED